MISDLTIIIINIGVQRESVMWNIVRVVSILRWIRILKTVRRENIGWESNCREIYIKAV